MSEAEHQPDADEEESPEEELPAEESAELRASYKKLGLEPGASMHEIEAAYWEFARKLRGQASMAPYNAAYEALVNRNRHPEADEEAVTPDQPAKDKKPPPAERPRSKFNWPST